MTARHLIVAVIALCAAAIAPPAAATERLYACDDLAERAELTALNSKLYQGDDGWFFRDSDLNHFYMLSPQTFVFLQRLRDVLSYRGITLALMPLPPKSILEPEHAVAATTDGDVLFDPEFARDEFAHMIDGLKASGLATADVLGILAETAADMEGDYYFARDIHWRPKLAKASAAAVAKLLLETVGPSIEGTTQYATAFKGEIPNESNTNTIINQLCSVPVPGETVAVYATESTDQSFDSFLGDGESAPPVSVIGTSFTDEAKPFNFSGFLREDLRSEVATYAISGGGVSTSLFKWAYDGLAATSGTKALVWELPYPDRIESAAPAMAREIVPAIVGACTGTPNELKSEAYAFGAGGSATFSIDDRLAVGGNDYYFAVTLSDPTIIALTMIFDYRDGSQDVLPVIRPDRVQSMSNAYGELSGDVAADLASVTITTLTGRRLSGTISLCRYPADIWRPVAIAAQ